MRKAIALGDERLVRQLDDQLVSSFEEVLAYDAGSREEILEKISFLLDFLEAAPESTVVTERARDEILEIVRHFSADWKPAR